MSALAQKNLALARKLGFIAVAMFGFGYALVPLYDVLCKLIGQNQTTIATPAAETAAQPVAARDVSVEFLTTVNGSAPIQFSVEKNKMRIHPGEYYTVNFYAKNTSNKTIKAQAIPHILPGLSKDYFKKVQCFCFVEQTFAPGEAKTMPVRFVVEPNLPNNYNTITLAYTFFDNTDKSVTN